MLPSSFGSWKSNILPVCPIKDLMLGRNSSKPTPHSCVFNWAGSGKLRLFIWRNEALRSRSFMVCCILGIIITSKCLDEVICHPWSGYQIWCSGLYRWWSFAFSGNLSIQLASVRASPVSHLPLLYVDFSLKNLSPHRFLFFPVYPKVFIPDIKVTQLLFSLKTKSHLYLMSFFK